MHAYYLSSFEKSDISSRVRHGSDMLLSLRLRLNRPKFLQQSSVFVSDLSIVFYCTAVGHLWSAFLSVQARAIRKAKVRAAARYKAEFEVRGRWRKTTREDGGETDWREGYSIEKDQCMERTCFERWRFWRGGQRDQVDPKIEMDELTERGEESQRSAYFRIRPNW